MKRRYKILPLSFPFTQPYALWADCVDSELFPQFNRNGYYMDRKTKQVWIEVGGRAWLYEGVETFLHDLAHAGVRRLEDHVYRALPTLLFDSGVDLSGRAHSELFRKWSVETYLREMGRARRDAQLTTKKFMKSI